MPSVRTSPKLSLLDLPAELLTITASYLPSPDLLALQLSCHYLSSLLFLTVSGGHLSPVKQMESWDRLPPRCPTEVGCANCVTWGWGERVADALSREEKKGLEREETSRTGKGNGKERVTSSFRGNDQHLDWLRSEEVKRREWTRKEHGQRGHRGRACGRGRRAALGSESRSWRDR